ncbi:MAG: sigma factor, partial [Pseudomonadota bacterium]
MTDEPQPDAQATTEQIARASYGKLIAILASQNGDIAAAEDALADAFAKALQHWPQTGVPEKPEAWLITAARNRQKDINKAAHIKTSAGSIDDEKFQMKNTAIDLSGSEQSEIPDKRLQLMFACAHPSIEPSIHTPLMLQTILGLEASQIASAYLMPSATL